MTSGHGRVMPRGGSGRSCYISADAPIREKDIGCITSDLSLFYQNVEAMKKVDFNTSNDTKER